MSANVAYERGKQSAHSAAEIVSEPRTRGPQGRWKKLAEVGAHRAERSGGKESQGKPEREHQMVRDRKAGVENHGKKGAGSKQYQGPLSSNHIRQVSGGHIPAESSQDDDDQVRPSIERTQPASAS